MGIRRQNRTILSREVCLGIYRVFVETWNIYLLGGGERNVDRRVKKNKWNYSKGWGKERDGSGGAVASDTARERCKEEEGILRSVEGTP